MLLLGLLLAMNACKKKDNDPWNLFGKWRVVKYTEDSNPIEDSPMLGRVYDLRDDYSCSVTDKDGNEIESGSWGKDRDDQSIRITEHLYIIYEAKGDTLTFGTVGVQGRDEGTFHTIRFEKPKKD